MAIIRPYYNKRAGREDVKAYFVQAGYTLAFFLLAWLLDAYLVADIIRSYSNDSLVINLSRFFTYPVCLVLASEVQRKVKKEDKDIGKTEFKPRIRY